MTEEDFLTLIKFTFFVLLSLWILIAFNIWNRKYRQRQLAVIENTFADIVSRHLYGNLKEEMSLLDIQRTFRNMGISRKKPRNVQFLINLMIRTQRSLLGENNKKISELYAKIPPYKASFRKTQDRRWYVRAQGIREIYEMNQPQYTPYIAQFRNDPNVYIRREAQIALVIFLGWESLRFLPYLDREIELWQQIKIVEKMHDLYRKPRIEYLKKSYGVKHDSGKELIMRIIRKFELQEELDYVITHLCSDSFQIRETAIYCLSSFKLNSRQSEAVKNMFGELKNLQQQRQVLAIIVNSSDNDDIDFYTKILKNSTSELLQLKVSEVLWNKGYARRVEKFYRTINKKEAQHKIMNI